MTDAASRSRMPVALLTGFLGSGKTTLVNALLRDPRMEGTAVAVNEFGAVALDQHLIDAGGDRTVVLANGCLCCNVAGDMEAGIMRLFARRAAGGVPAFARLIVEPSGLADPAPIAQAILRNPVMSRALRLDAVVATVDALFAEKQFLRHAETRKQVAMADRIVVTKPDLADAESLSAAKNLARAHNPVAEIAHVRDGAIDAGWLFPPEFLDPDLVVTASYRSALMADAIAHGAATEAVVLLADAPLPWARFDAWLRSVRLAHGEALLRVKAMLDVVGAAGPVVVHGVHHVMHTPVERAVWPDDERGSRVVLITQGLDTDALRRSWADMLAYANT